MRSIAIKSLVLVAISLGFFSCDSPRNQAMRSLMESGVEITGRSLLRAVDERDLEKVALLLESRVFTGQRDAHGRTPLAISVATGDLDMVKILINGHADVNANLAGGTSILGLAAERGDPLVMGALLANGARTDGLMPDGDRILPWAIRKGREDLVSLMMKGDTDPHMKDHLGNPLLHLAMDAGRRDLMEVLIRGGADPGSTNAAGEGTIELALRHGWMDVIPRLVANGADPNGRTLDGDMLLEHAFAESNERLIKLLLISGADPSLHGSKRSSSPLEDAFAQADPTRFAMILTCTTRPPHGGWDPWLIRAVKGRDLEKSRLLLAHGARGAPSESHKTSLLEAAVLREGVDFIKLLLDYGHPIGRSLELACERGNARLAEMLLLAGGACPEQTGFPSKDTILTAAIRRGDDALAALLLRHGANPEQSLPDGQSAFHLAVAKGCAETVSVLLAVGTDPNTPFSQPVSTAFIHHFRPGAMRWMLKNDRNPTPLMAAADNGHVRTAQVLIRAGAKVNAKTRSPVMWPLNFAANRQDIRMMRLILGKDPFREERIIEISLPNQEAVMRDGEGNELFKTKVSTGKSGYATPAGEYVITNKHRHWTSTLYHASMPYFQRLSCGDFGLHQGSVPDYPASHGCIRVPAGKASKLFSLTQMGDRVRILK